MSFPRGHDPNRHGGPGPARGTRETRGDSRRSGDQHRRDRRRIRGRAIVCEPDCESADASEGGDHEKRLHLLDADRPRRAARRQARGPRSPRPKTRRRRSRCRQRDSSRHCGRACPSRARRRQLGTGPLLGLSRHGTEGAPAGAAVLPTRRRPFSRPITKARFLNKARAARFLRTRPRGDALATKGGQRMQGAIEALLSGLVVRGLGPVVSGILMAAPLKKVARAQLKKIYVLDERGEMAGEYILDPDCPIDYNDFLKVLPDEGIGDRDSLFVGEYVFTAFQSGKFAFVLLSRGLLDPAAGRGFERSVPIREDPGNRRTTRGEFQRRLEEGGVESQFRRATSV